MRESLGSIEQAILGEVKITQKQELESSEKKPLGQEDDEKPWGRISNWGETFAVMPDQ